MSIFDDLPDIFTETLGGTVTYTHAGTDPVSINAIEMRESVLEGGFGVSAQVNATRVVLQVRTIDVPALAEGDAFDLPATSFRSAGSYRAVQPITQDSKGMTAVTLSKGS